VPEHLVGRNVDPLEQFMKRLPRRSEMTSKTSARRPNDDEGNPKIGPAPNSNIGKMRIDALKSKRYSARDRSQ
jgi:hypothetical protein